MRWGECAEANGLGLGQLQLVAGMIVRESGIWQKRGPRLSSSTSPTEALAGTDWRQGFFTSGISSARRRLCSEIWRLLPSSRKSLAAHSHQDENPFIEGSVMDRHSHCPAY